MKAKKLKDITGWKGAAACYEVDPPIGGHKFVIVSAVASAFDTGEPETFIFKANEEGECISFLDLAGSQRGICDQSKVLEDLGYEIV